MYLLLFLKTQIGAKEYIYFKYLLKHFKADYKYFEVEKKKTFPSFFSFRQIITKSIASIVPWCANEDKHAQRFASCKKKPRNIAIVLLNSDSNGLSSRRMVKVCVWLSQWCEVRYATVGYFFSWSHNDSAGLTICDFVACLYLIL